VTAFLTKNDKMADGGGEKSGKKKEESVFELLYLPFGKMFKNR